MKHELHFVGFEHALGVLGLFLMLVVARLADHGYAAHQTFGGRLLGFTARRVIDAIGVIGWLADRLPESAATKGGRR